MSYVVQNSLGLTSVSSDVEEKPEERTQERETDFNNGRFTCVCQWPSCSAHSKAFAEENHVLADDYNINSISYIELNKYSGTPSTLYCAKCGLDIFT